MTQNLENLKNAIESHTGKNARKSGKGYRLPCPAHNGKDPNLYIADGDTKLIIKCFSHLCDPKDIVESAGLSLADIYSDRLTGDKLKEHRVIRKELELELLVLLFWLSDVYRGVWPVNVDADVSRVNLAWKRVKAAAIHFTKEGVE